jgi:signal transduction histidine kinase
MIQRIFPSIGARLGFFVSVILVGFIVVVVTNATLFNLIDQANKKRDLLLDQEHSSHLLYESVLNSMILIDRIILEDQGSVIPELLALSEDTLGHFGRYQSTAQSAGLEHDRYAADEHEPLIFRIRSDFFEIALHYQNNELQQAREKRLEMIERRLPALISFIVNSQELRVFDLADVSSQISELNRIEGITIVVVFITFVLCVVIVAVAVSRSIVKPIASLKYLVDHFMSTGQMTDLLKPSRYKPKDELAHLTESFRNLASQLLENKVQQDELIEDLGQKNTELERFAYTVSHDLKSPLVTVSGFIGLLERDIAAGDETRIREDIQAIMSATDTMATLLEDLLELSRVGRQVSPSQEISLTELSEGAVDDLQISIREHKAEIKIQTDMPTVFADKLRIGEVIQNLLENAIKFSGEGNYPHIEISATREKDNILVLFKDNGIGIDPRYHDTVFGLFNRLDSNIPGTGVGLALVKRIVEIHGGQIWIESTGNGQGSTFCFSLPAT